MKKIWILILILLSFLFCTGADMSEAQRLSDNEYGISFSETAEKISDGRNPFDIEKLFLTVTDGLTKEIADAFLSLGTVISVIFLFSVSGFIKGGSIAGGVSGASFFAVYSVVCTILLGNFAVVSETVTKLIGDVVLFMNAAVPLVGSAAVASGNFAVYSAMHPLITACGVLSANIIKSIGVPSLVISLSLSAVGNISENFSLSEAGKTIRSASLWLICGLLTLFSAAVAICGISAPGINSVAIKSAKFIVRSAVPVLGGLLSDSTEVVMMGGMMLKNAVGTAAVICIFAMLLYPLIKVVAVVFSYRITASLISPLCDRRITSLLNDIAGVLSCMGAFAVAECVVAVVSVVSLLSASNAGVMLN